MQQRRVILGASAAALFHGGFASNVWAQESELDYEDIANPFDPSVRLYGTAPASGLEEDMARNILDAAPRGLTLLETARYFEAIKEINANGQPYNAQWSKRWNPVIVGFYQATSLPHPYVYKNGDTIDWCAAFINWCLTRAGLPDTGSAMSGSFRLGKGYGKATTEPKAGDIIVFRKADPTEAAVGHGHVAIFLDKVDGGYKILGGNQRAGKRYSSVNTTFMPEKSDSLVFDSVRSMASIPLLKAKA